MSAWQAVAALAQAARHALPVQPLTAEAFAPYGQVIELGGSGTRQISINDGRCMRHHDLARPLAAAPGAVAFSLFDAAATALPARLTLMERHRLGSQSFAPFGTGLQLVAVVADAAIAADALGPQHLRAFLTNGQQGLQLSPGVWHHPLLSLQAGPWLVADRIAPEVDCDVVRIDAWGVDCGG